MTPPMTMWSYCLLLLRGLGIVDGDGHTISVPKVQGRIQDFRKRGVVNE